MPNYPTHSRWGRIGGAVVAIVVAAGLFFAFEALTVAIAAALAAGITTFAGSIYPDVDHHKSIPRRKAVRGFQGLTIVAIASAAALYWTAFVPLVESLAIQVAGPELPAPPELISVAVVLVGTFVAASLVDPLIGLVTFRHRGWTHSVPINAVLIAIVAAAVWVLTRELPVAHQAAAIAVVAAFFAGTLIHLGLDGEIR